MLVKVSKDIPATHAAFLEPLATVIHGIKKLRVRPLENIVVIGAGPLGNSSCAGCKAIWRTGYYL